MSQIDRMGNMIDGCEVADQRWTFSSSILALCLHGGERMDERMSDEAWTTRSAGYGAPEPDGDARTARLLAGAEGLRIDAGGYRSRARLLLEAARLARVRGEPEAVAEAVQAARQAHLQALKTTRFARTCEMRADRLSTSEDTTGNG